MKHSKNGYDADFNEFDDFNTPYQPVRLESNFLHNWLHGLDAHICNLTDRVKHHKEKEEEYRKLYSQEVHKGHQAIMGMVANTLVATISTPSAHSLGSVGATIVRKIREMGTIEEIHTYIDDMFAEMSAELKAEE